MTRSQIEICRTSTIATKLYDKSFSIQEPEQLAQYVLRIRIREYAKTTHDNLLVAVVVNLHFFDSLIGAACCTSVIIQT